MPTIEDFEKYIIQPNNITDSCITRHLTQNELCNDMINIEEWIAFLQKEQRDSLKIWLDFLNTTNYSDEIKNWILNGVLKSAHYEKGHFGRRNSHTIHTFPELNQRCVEKVLENKSMDTSFQNQYAQKIKELLEQKSDNGIWKIYSGLNDIQSLLDVLQGWFTRWCINSYSSAVLHLSAGDIHIFFTEIDDRFIYPRLSVGVEKTGTVRCIGLEPYQMIEECMKPILERRLSELGISNQDKTYRIRYGSSKNFE